MKKCSICKESKPLSEFYKDKYKKDGYRSDCKRCNKILYTESSRKYYHNNKNKSKIYRSKPEVKFRRAKLTREWNKNNLNSVLLTHARKRAKQLNIECSLNKEDIIVPDICPVLGIPIKYSDNKMSDFSPSVDRINPKLGYTKENISVISVRANRIKNDASLDELLKISEWLKCKIR